MLAGVMVMGGRVATALPSNEGLFGHLIADGMWSTTWHLITFLTLAMVVLPLGAILHRRHEWQTLMVDDEGVRAIGAGGRSRRVAWADVRGIDLVRSRRRTIGYLRARRLSVALQDLYPSDTQATRPRRRPELLETDIASDLVARRATAVRLRRVTGEDVLAISVLLVFFTLEVAPRIAVDRDIEALNRANAAVGSPPESEIAALDEWLARQPTDGVMRSRRASALAKLGRFDEARAESDRAVDDDPRTGFTWSARREIADTSGDMSWSVAAWMQSHAAFMRTWDDEATASSTEDAAWRMEVGRRLFLAGEFVRARRWFAAAARSLVPRDTSPQADYLVHRVAALAALCDVADGRPQAALDALAHDPGDHSPPLVVRATALRCLGRSDELAVTLARIEALPVKSAKSAVARTMLVAWLRGGDVEIPSTLATSPDTARLVAFEAPLLALALRSCEEKGEGRR
jgi:hypothetical protein